MQEFEAVSTGLCREQKGISCAACPLHPLAGAPLSGEIPTTDQNRLPSQCPTGFGKVRVKWNEIYLVIISRQGVMIVPSPGGNIVWKRA